MVGEQVIDTIIRYIAQRVNVTDESFLRRAQLLDMFNVCRADILGNFIIKLGTEAISPINYITSYIEKSEFDDLSKEYSYFKIDLSVMGMYDFVGSEDGKCRFTEVRTISEEQNPANKRIRPRTFYYLSNHYLKINNPTLTAIQVNRIPVNPLNVETFNYEYDEYPIDEALIDQVCEMIFKTYFSKISQAQADLSSNSAPV